MLLGNAPQNDKDSSACMHVWSLCYIRKFIFYAYLNCIYDSVLWPQAFRVCLLLVDCESKTPRLWINNIYNTYGFLTRHSTRSILYPPRWMSGVVRGSGVEVKCRPAHVVSAGQYQCVHSSSRSRTETYAAHSSLYSSGVIYSISFDLTSWNI